mmetsp:Transcript_2464/g.5889  ORF Transcript_2464/g.5889 Transcript_2464/m.5889 type:complete len:83 (+) Transcript_2464:286-534(+)
MDLLTSPLPIKIESKIVSKYRSNLSFSAISCNLMHEEIAEDGLKFKTKHRDIIVGLILIKELQINQKFKPLSTFSIFSRKFN